MHIVIAIPAYTGQIHLSTMRSLFTDLLALKERGDSFTVHDECGNALIGDARAQIVAEFLSIGADQLVFVDSDVCWEKGSLLRLIDAPHDFVAGIYPQRKDPIAYCVKWDQSKEHLQADEHGFLKVEGVPAGFMRLTRDMLLKMADHYPNLEFYCENAPDKKAFALFDPYRIGKHKMGEDYAFCKRWTDIGGEIFIDPEIKMGHVGYKTFPGCIGDWLRAR